MTIGWARTVGRRVGKALDPAAPDCDPVGIALFEEGVPAARHFGDVGGDFFEAGQPIEHVMGVDFPYRLHVVVGDVADHHFTRRGAGAGIAVGAHRRSLRAL